MFKKFIISLMVVIVMVFGVAVMQPNQVLTQASAASYDKYLNGDHNYQLIYGHMGSAIYLDISSIVVIQNDSHQVYKWAQNEVAVDTEKGNAITNTKTKWYGWANDGSDQGAFYYSMTGDNNWKQFDLTSDAGYMESTTEGFRAGFYHAFGFPFS